MFNLDTPQTKELNYLTKFAGWYIPEESIPVGGEVKLQIYLNGKPHAALLHGGDRPDVAKVFPDKKNAATSGFWGELLLPETIKPESNIEIEIVAEGNPTKSLYKNQFKVIGKPKIFPERERIFNLEEMLKCPSCDNRIKKPGLFEKPGFWNRDSLTNRQDACSTNSCQQTNCPIWKRGNTFHFLQPEEVPFTRLTEPQNTHPYSESILKVLEKIGDKGIVLDFGAGNTQPEYLKPNICYLEVQQYPFTDIVCTTPKLPFADNSFDGVISHAVFEHIPNPFITAKELFRILKPGGLIFIDTAFLQPFHSDPNHYFNMTIQGLRQIMSDFEEINSGILEHHYPSYSLMMLIRIIWPHLEQKQWKNRLADWHAFLIQEGDNLDEMLGEKGREILAAGVFFEGRKPI
ncbi:MAG: class I SAM-dependent methyltransferase [Cyanobacteriota bacterium]|nr:class I SAM-dependent methyltransferase [Cyanobacteriota bacterium]